MSVLLLIALKAIMNSFNLHKPSSQNLLFSHLTVEDGLSDNVGGDLLQDMQGFIWITTYDGLNRYDGYEFKVFRHDPENPNSLSNGLIRGMVLDQDGLIWLATIGGLNKFNPYTETFTRYQHQPCNLDSLGFDFCISVFIDQDGLIWVGGLGAVDCFDPRTDTFTHFNHNPDMPTTIGPGQVHSICQDQTGNLWFGNRAGGGLSRFDPSQLNFIHYRHNPENPHSISNDSIQVLYMDRADKLWIGTEHGGLNQFDPETESFHRHQFNPQNPFSLSDDYVRDILQDNAGDLWIATAGGLNKMDYASGKFTQYRHDPANSTSISTNNVSRVFIDRNEGLWVTTFQGINYSSPKYQRFRQFRHEPSNPNSLDDNSVRTIYEDSLGNLWIGTEKGLNKYDRDHGKFTRYQHDHEDPASLSPNLFIAAIVEDADHILWIGSWGGELNCFDPETERFWRPGDDPAFPRIRDTLALHRDHHQNIWIGDYNQGIYCFFRQEENQIPQHYELYSHDPDDPDSLSANTISVIYEDGTHTLWVGTETGGLNRIDPNTEIFIRYEHDLKDPASLSNNWVEVIFQDHTGCLWFGTKQGLNRFVDHFDDNPHENSKASMQSTGTFKSYTEKDGMSNAIVIGILEEQSCPGESETHLWLSTNQGIVKFNPQSEIFHNYGTAEGLQTRSEVSGYWKSRSGEMLFGGYGGLTSFYPDQIIDNKDVPPVLITNFLLFNEPTPIGGDSPLQKAIWATKEIALSENEYGFAFEFAALNYVAPQKNLYKYKLEGFDQDWHIVSSKRRYAAYTNIAAGEYTFRVLGSNNHGVWNLEGASIKIEVAQPLWEKLRQEKEAVETVNLQLKQEIEERKRVELKLQELATTDPLTGLNNRRYFFELAKKEFIRARRYHHELTMMMLDLDHFKRINDQNGHLAGDTVLEAAAKFLRDYTRETDILGRYGGDEFTILLPQTSLSNGQHLAERLCQRISTQQIMINEHSIAITFSIGIAILLAEDTSIDMLVSRADQALYLVKQSGRNRVVIWNPK